MFDYCDWMERTSWLMILLNLVYKYEASSLINLRMLWNLFYWSLQIVNFNLI